MGTKVAENAGCNLPETGEEWLRLLVSEPLHLFPEGVNCTGCGIFIPTGGALCPRCGGECNPIDWRSVNRKIKMALRRQKGLLATVKADYENLFSPETRILMRGPNLTGELSWLTFSWDRARRPKGRPFEVWRFFKLANLMEMILELKKVYKKEKDPKLLEAMKFILGVIEAESPRWEAWDLEHVERRKKRIKAWVRKYRRDPIFRLLGRRI